MKKFIVSNRVFWAGVALACSSVVGWSISHAAPSDLPEIRARKLVIVDEAGKTVISMGSQGKSDAIMLIGRQRDAGEVAILSSPEGGPAIMFTGRDKARRFIYLDKSKDNTMPPAKKKP